MTEQDHHEQETMKKDWEWSLFKRIDEQEARESRRDMSDQLRSERAWDRPDRSEL